MTGTSLVGIDLFHRDNDTLADRVRRAGQARALVDFAKTIETRARADLRAAVDAEAERTGTGFSAKVDGIRASLSDPQPKPYVTDRLAFEIWWSEQDGFEYTEQTYVEVTDPVRALGVIRSLESCPPPADAALKSLLSAIEVRTIYLIPANALDSLTDDGTYTATDDGLVETATGELVPGVACRRADPALTVTPSKEAKARHAQIVASFFNADPVALERGDDA